MLLTRPSVRRMPLSSSSRCSGSVGERSNSGTDYPTPAQRPSYSLLDCTATHKALDLPPTHWRQALRQLLEAVA